MVKVVTRFFLPFLTLITISVFLIIIRVLPIEYLKLVALISVSLITFTSSYFLPSGFLHNIRVIGITIFFCLALLVIITGNQLLQDNVEKSFRVVLFFGDPNTLAASLVVLAASLITISSNVTAWFISILLLPAALFTGSRLGLLCSCIIILYVCIHFIIKHRFIGTILTISIFVASVITSFEINHILDEVYQMKNSSNLLVETERFQAPWWNTYQQSIVNIETHVVEGPFPNTEGHFISMQSHEPYTLTFYQRIKKANSQENYISSIYVRSDIPTEFVLGNNLATSICSVSIDWSRCITPTERGDDYHSLQFQLQTLEANEQVQFYFWGPQLEIGRTPTLYSPKRILTNLEAIILRLDFTSRFVTEGFLFNRFEAWGEGYLLFLDHPWFGSGDEISLHSSHNHAHNFLLNLLVRYGLFGGLLLLMAFRPFLNVNMASKMISRASILFICIFLLNTLDDTFFFWMSFIPFFFVLGIIYFSRIEDGIFGSFSQETSIYVNDKVMVK